MSKMRFRHPSPNFTPFNAFGASISLLDALGSSILAPSPLVPPPRPKPCAPPLLWGCLGHCVAIATGVRASKAFNETDRLHVLSARRSATLAPCSRDGSTIYRLFRYIDSKSAKVAVTNQWIYCLLYTSPSPRDRTRSRMPSSA